jgi:hypothetical protein
VEAVCDYLGPSTALTARRRSQSERPGLFVAWGASIASKRALADASPMVFVFVDHAGDEVTQHIVEHPDLVIAQAFCIMQEKVRDLSKSADAFR